MGSVSGQCEATMCILFNPGPRVEVLHHLFDFHSNVLQVQLSLMKIQALPTLAMPPALPVCPLHPLVPPKRARPPSGSTLAPVHHHHRLFLTLSHLNGIQRKSKLLAARVRRALIRELKKERVKGRP